MAVFVEVRKTRVFLSALTSLFVSSFLSFFSPLCLFFIIPLDRSLLSLDFVLERSLVIGSSFPFLLISFLLHIF